MKHKLTKEQLDIFKLSYQDFIKDIYEAKASKLSQKLNRKRALKYAKKEKRRVCKTKIL